jgi:hypothetical protein
MNESKTKLGIAAECGHFLKCGIPKKVSQSVGRTGHWIQQRFIARFP